MPANTGVTPVDLDQGGSVLQSTKAYLGPSLGHVIVYVKPETHLTTQTAYTIQPGDGVILVDVGSQQITITLPSVSQWVLEPFYRPATAFDRGLWIKDYGGNAAAFPIIITPFGTDKIDGLSGSFQVIQNRQLLRLYPISDLTGWFSG